MDFSYEYLLKHRERFESVYGADKTGSLYKSENLSDFAQYVRERSGGEGAHLVVAGGVGITFATSSCPIA